ncbi:hypothetical protein N7533_000323 [Penicillium manginii]|uniref:uncharacterized protein n=1 Tax=Penicillium manginii TaxID=203109 RepID=UPI002546DED3|nr:uncharacterized protein N7533_000323 [Penicillium manginii]KAJ5767740.1 hypothetical protein N7533_000323 [Penicillium manginii]
MAPKIFERFFKREKKRNDRDRPSASWPTAIGISDLTCEIKGDRFNGWKLPIPAPGERHALTNMRVDSLDYPPEVRRRIYIELMGNRRVHIEYAWMLQSPFEPPTKRGGKRWDWWHSVCQENDSFVQDTYLESCPDRGDERWNARQKGVSVRPTPGTKFEGVEWLRCCQIGYVVLVGLGLAIQVYCTDYIEIRYEEALQVLYGTNVFVPREGIDSPFILSRMLSPICMRLIKSLDITIGFHSWLGSSQHAQAWETVYPALFRLLENEFSSVQSLRLTIHFLNWKRAKDAMTEEKLNEIMGPWDRLATGREWKFLQLCVPFDWQLAIKPRAEAQSIWELKHTEWYHRLTFTECT